MCVHLLVNASIVAGPETFQNNVHNIHALGPALPLIEWVFIFIPIIFHAVVGVMIVSGMVPNVQHYRYGANWRYVAQRVTGVLAFFFIGYHVFHMHGWFHAEWWLAAIEPIGGAQFRPYNAASTAGMALQNLLVATIYAIGVLASVFHLANGIWTMGITWGVWTRPAAQQRALYACSGFGIVLAVVGLSALWGAREVGSGEQLTRAIEAENRMTDKKIEMGMLPESHEKRLERSEPQLNAPEQQTSWSQGTSDNTNP
jgi:succinate dehydrogenase / fumarate reductase cytochrome b subunit